MENRDYANENVTANFDYDKLEKILDESIEEFDLVFDRTLEGYKKKLESIRSRKTMETEKLNKLANDLEKMEELITQMQRIGICCNSDSDLQALMSVTYGALIISTLGSLAGENIDDEFFVDTLNDLLERI